MEEDGILVLGVTPASEEFTCHPTSCLTVFEELTSLFTKLKRIETKLCRQKQLLIDNKCEDSSTVNFWVVKLRSTYQKFHSAYLKMTFLSCAHPLKLQSFTYFSQPLEEYARMIASHPLSSHELTNLPPADVSWNGM